MPALPLLALAAAVAAQLPAWKPAADDLARPLVEGRDGVGLVIGVHHRGRPLVFGYGSVETPAGRVTPDGRTLFEVGSITKTFTGLLLAEAVRRGEVRLDDPLTRHLPPDLPFRPHADGPPTLLQCATHRSGLPVQPPLIGLTARNPANPYADLTRGRLAATLRAIRPAAPGKKSVYSNLAAGLLGHALVNAAGADSFEALVRERVCRPLGLRDTTEAPTGAQRGRLAPGHDADGKPTAPWDFATLEACGGLRSTADDLLRYAAAHLGERDTPLKASMAAARAARQDEGGGRSTGLFWVRMPLKGVAGTAVWHNGGTGGHRSMLLTVPEQNMAVVVLCNADAGSQIDRLAIELTRAVAEGK